MKCSFDISDFLEEISSLSHSIIFLDYIALITEEGINYFARITEEGINYFALITEEGILSLLAILWNAAFK